MFNQFKYIFLNKQNKNKNKNGELQNVLYTRPVMHNLRSTACGSSANFLACRNKC